jgi:hypothetical protein
MGKRGGWTCGGVQVSGTRRVWAGLDGDSHVWVIVWTGAGG